MGGGKDPGPRQYGAGPLPPEPPPAGPVPADPIFLPAEYVLRDLAAGRHDRWLPWANVKAMAAEILARRERVADERERCAQLVDRRADTMMALARQEIEALRPTAAYQLQAIGEALRKAARAIREEAARG